MAAIAARELRNNTRSVLDRVRAGEEIEITLDGEPVAVLRAVVRRPDYMTREEFVRRVLPHQADPGLLRELREVLPDTTDDLRW